MAGFMGYDPNKYTIYKPRLTNFYVVNNPNVPQVPAPQPFSVVPHNNPYQSVINAQTRLMQSGQPVPEPDKPGAGTLLFKALDLIDRPRNAIFSGIRGITDDNRNTGFFSEAWRGLKGEVKTYGSDFIPEAAPKPVRAVGGFLLDVLGDPLTYLTAGAGKAGQIALTTGAKVAAKSAGTMSKLRTALGVADDIPINREMVEGLVKRVEDALPVAKNTLADASRAATQSINAYFPGLKPDTFDPSVLGRLGELIRSGGLRDAAIDPDINRKLFERFNIKGQLDREAILREQFGSDKVFRIATFLESTADLTDLQFLDKLDTTGRRLTTLDAVYASLESKLPSQMRNLEPRQKALALQLFDYYGTDSGLDIFTAAQRLDKAIPKRKLSLGAGLEKLQTNLDKLSDAERGLAAAENEVQITRELSAQFEKETGRYFIKYMGKPIVDIAPVKDYVAKNLALPAYEKIPLVKGIVDTWGMLFVPSYIQFSERFKETIGPSLVKFEQMLSKTLRREHSIPYTVVREAATTLGTDFVENPKLNKALGYFMEANMSKNMIPDLERALAAGDDGAKASLAAAMEAIKYWDEIAPSFSPEEIEALKRAARAYDLTAQDLFETDQKIKRIYDPVEGGYYHHVYEDDPSVVEKHLREVLPQRERVRRKLSTGLAGVDKERRFMTLAYARKVGLKPIDDAMVSLSVRKFRTSIAKYHYELAENLLKLPGIVSDTPVSGFVKYAKEIPKLTGKYVHPEVARHLNRVDYLFYTDAGFSSLMRGMQQITNMVKQFQVGYNPNFLARNMVGEAVMNLIAGVTPQSHSAAYNALRGATDKIKLGDGTVKSLQEIIGEFQDEGLWYAGVTRGNIATSLQQITTEEARAMAGKGRSSGISIIGKYKLSDAPRAIGQKVGARERMGEIANAMDAAGVGEVKFLNPGVIRETSDWLDKFFRLAQYIDNRVKGLTAEASATEVRKFHVDYQDLTPSEKHFFRHIVPYYTYFRKNLPIQLRLLAEQPGYQTAIAKLVNNASHALGDPELSKYATENLALPLYEQENGDVVVLNWNLPIVDLGRVHGSFRANMQEQLGSLTPFVRVPFEIATNRTLSVDRPIERYAGEKLPLLDSLEGSPQVSAKLKYALEQFGGSLVNLPSSAAGALTGYEREIPDRPRQVPVFQSLFPIQRPSTAEQAALYRYRDKLLAAIQAAEAAGNEVISVRDLR